MEVKEENKFIKGKIRSIKPLIIILLTLALLIPISVYTVLYITEIRIKAKPTEQPEKIEVTNITDSSSVISWVTKTVETIGYVNYSNSEDLKNTALDVRDKDKANGKYYIHYVEITGLSVSSTYYYSIIVGGKEYKKSQSELYEFKTGSTISSLSTPQPIKGIVEDPSGSLEDIIIYLYVEKGNFISNKISTITTNKQYSLDLSNLRSMDLNNTFTDLNGSSLYILAQGGNRGEGTISTQILNLAEL